MKSLRKKLGRKSTTWVLFCTAAFFALITLGMPTISQALNPMIGYSEDGVSDIKYSLYTSGNWGTGSTAVDTTNYQYWKVVKSNPTSDRQVVVSVDSAATPNLLATFWDGTNWDDSSGSPYGDAKTLGSIYTSAYRCFDAAYEQSSGRLLIVAGNTAARQIKFWVWDGSSWVVNGTTYTIGTPWGALDYVRWVKLAAKPGSDEIALIVSNNGADASGKAYALIWNSGTNSWGNGVSLGTTVSTTTTETIAIEYMQAGTNAGKALTVWAQSNNNMYGRVWNGSGWDAATLKAASANTARRLRLKADPNSDKLLLGIHYSGANSDINVIPWTGSAWGTLVSIDTNPSGNGDSNRVFDVIFESASSHAIIAYSTTTSGMRYQHSADGGATWGGATALSASDQAYWIQLERQSDGTVYLAAHDTNSDLKTWIWDGSSWTAKNTISTDLEYVSSAGDREVIGLNIPGTVSATLTLANHTPPGQVGDQFTTTSPVTAVLFRFNLIVDGTVTVDTLSVNYTTANGISDGEITQGELWADTDDDGEVDDPGDTKIEDSVTGASGMLTFSTDFAPATYGDNYLIRATVSNLVCDDKTTFSMTTTNITVVEPAVAKVGGTTSIEHKEEGTLTLADHGSGQVSDAFNYVTPETDVLYQFKLTQAGTVSVSSLYVHFTNGATYGVWYTNVTAGELWEDTNGNGTWDDTGGGDTLLKGGVAADSSGNLVFTPASAFTPGTGGTIYFIRATVADLTPGDNTTFSMTTAYITASPTSATKSGTATDAYHIANGTLTLADHSTQGQVTDKFTTAASTTDVLFRFRLTQEGTFSVANLRVTYSATGILDSHITNAELWADTDNDGVIDDPGDNQIQNSIGGSGGMLTFTTDFEPLTGTNYLVKVTVNSLEAGDTVTFSLDASGIDSTADPYVVESGSVANATHTADGSLLLENHTLGQQDQFSTSTPVTNKGLFRFKLTRTGTLDVHGLTVHYTTTGGVVYGDVTSASLYYDGGDGECGTAGDTLIQTGVAPSDGYITFTTPFNVSASGSLYVVCATVANLVAGDTTTFHVGTADIDTHNSVSKSSTVTDAVHTADGSLALANHTSGQVGDALTGATPQTAVFYRFNLTRTGNFSVTELRVNYTTTGGIEDANVTNGKLWKDDGTVVGQVDAGDHQLGSTVNGSGGKLTFSGLTEQPGTSGTNYLIQATLINLETDDTTTFSLGTADIDAGAATESGTIDNAIHLQEGTVTLANHAAGQESNSFDAGSSVENAELFAFKLTNNQAGTTTVNQVEFTLSSVTGISQGDFSSLTLCVDDDGDGAIETGETTTVGGSGSVDSPPTKITFSTSFDIAASATVNYILRGSVINLVNGDTVTVALTANKVTLASGTTGGSVTSNATHTAGTTTLTLAQHANGQEGNNFDAGTPITGAELFAFKLTTAVGSRATVSEIVLQIPSVTGIAQTDFANLVLCVDTDGDGSIETGETTTVGGAGVVDGGVTTITFSTDFTIAKNTTVNYIVKGDVSNLQTGDTVTIGLGTANITLTSGSATGTAPSNATHTVGTTTITLYEHAAGQEKDKFPAENTVSDVELFAFRLVRTSGQRATVSSVQFQLSSITGIETADLSDLKIYYDANGNGTIDGGETTNVGGTSPTVSIVGNSGTITFNEQFTLTSDGNLNYILKGDVANLAKKDTMTVSLSNSNVSITSGTVNAGSPATTSVMHYTGATPLIAYSDYAGTNYDLMYSDYLADAWDDSAIAIDHSANYFYWKVLKTDPSGDKQVVLSVKNNSGTYNLYASFYDGASWSTPENLGAVYSYYYRSFDAAYEQMNGELLVVADSTTAGQIKYWVYDPVGESWSGPTTKSLAYSTGRVQWVRLASKPGADEIALIVSDNAAKPEGLIWDGSTNTWGNEKQLTTGTLSNWNTETIAVEYMQAGTNEGKALFAWAESGYVYGWVWNGTSWDASVISKSVPAGFINWLRLKPSPIDDTMMLGFEYNSSNADIYALPWTGTDWGSEQLMTLSASGNGTYNHAFDVIYEASGHAIVVYSDTTQIRYQHYDGSWSGEQSPAAFSGFQALWVELDREANETIHLAVHEDTENDLNTWTWNGTAWTTGEEISVNLETQAGVESFAITMASMPSEQLRLYNHTEGQVGNQFGTSTTAEDVVVYRFKLKRAGEVTVTSLVVNYTTTGGVADGDITEAELYEDKDNDGTVSAGDTQLGSTVIGSGNKLTFSGLTASPSTTGTNYVIRATVSNLNPGDTSTFSCGKDDIVSNATFKTGTISDATHAAMYAVTLAAYGGGQESNKFTTASSVTGAELFRFQLKNNDTSVERTVTQLVFQLSSISGIVTTDLNNLQLYVDANGNGDIADDETTTVGGTGLVSIGGATGTITFGGTAETYFTIAAGATVQYILKGDASNLLPEDSVTIALGPSNITVASGSADGTAPANATHTATATLVLSDFGLPGQVASQVGDNLGAAASQTVILFRFKLKSSDAQVTVDSLKVNFTTAVAGGIANADVTAGELWLDDGDGAFDANYDTKIQDSVTPSGGILTFTTDFVTQAGTGANYYVRATVLNLIYMDTTTFSMSASDITPLQTSVTPTGSVTSATHTHDPGVLPQIVYSHYGSNDIYHTTYEQDAWQAETKLADTATRVYWKVARNTPNNSEQVAVWVDSQASPSLYVSFWDGASWGIGDQWVIDRYYAANDYAKNNGVSYKSKTTWTSTEDDEPGVGYRWTDYWTVVATPDQDLGFIATKSYRCFDVAYEQTSNELLIVATQWNGSFVHHIYYWTWNGQTLSGPHDYLVGSVGNTLQWIKLAPKSGSNEIAAIAGDSANNVYAFIWDGTQFNSDYDKTLSSGNLSSNTTEAIAVAYENSDTSLTAWLTGTLYAVGDYRRNKGNDYRCKTGHTSSASDEPGVGASWTTYWTLVTQAVFAWGSGSSGTLGYATWDSISKTYTTGSKTLVMGGAITWLRLATNPNSDDMILGMVDNTSAPNIGTLKWDGSAWATSTQDINSVGTGYKGSTTGNRAFDLIFEYDSNHLGHAVIVYGGTGNSQYRHSTNGGTSWGSEIQFPSTYNKSGYWIQLERNLDNVIHLALHDDTDALNALIWELRPAHEWALSTAYALNDYVWHNLVPYKCKQAHTSTSADEPGVGGSWTTYWGVNTWVLSTTYSADDYVWHNSVRYKCRSGHTSASTNEPGVGGSWTTYWNLDWTFKDEITAILEYGTSRQYEAFALVVNIPSDPEFGTQPPPPNLNYNWGSINARISLKGVNFGTAVGTVEFATSTGTQAAEILSWNPTEVIVRVPINAVSGSGVKLTNSWGKYATSTETFTVITGAPTFTKLIPTYASNFATVDIWRLTGTNLSPDCSIYLSKSGQTNISATVGGTKLYSSGIIDAATFALNGAATGTWNLTVKNPDDQLVTITDALTVTAPAEVSSGSSASYDSAGYSNARNIVRDSAGNWWAVFRGNAEVYINKREAGSAAWGTPVKLVGVSGALLYNNSWGIGLSHGGVSVDIYRSSNWPVTLPLDNSNDVLHIVWQAGYGSESKYIFYSKCSDLANYDKAASWSGIYQGWVTSRSYFVADLVYHNSNYYRCISAHTSSSSSEPGVGGSWNTYWDLTWKPSYDTVDSTAQHYTLDAAAPDIVIDHDGYVHVSYYIKPSVSSPNIKYRTNRTRSGHWDSIRSVASYGEYNPVTGRNYYEIALGASMDVDSNNYIHLAWSQVKDVPSTDDNYVIRYVKTTDWTTFPNDGNRVDIIQDDQDMETPSLVVDRDNNIYVVARELDASLTAPDDNDLWFAYYNGTAWSETNVSDQLRAAGSVDGKDRFKEYYLDLDIECPVVGTRERTTDHVLMTKIIGGYHRGKVFYLKWDDANKKWDYEKDPDAGTDSQYYVSLERRSPAYFMDIAYLFYDSSADKVKSEGIYGLDGTPTAVRLASFNAKGNGNQVLVEWVTKTEIDNLGFNLYKSTQKTGIYTKLNSKMIPGLLNSVSGHRYTYDDADVVKGQLYYYKLEDVDLKGKKTMHGPVCVDWDGDGIPDDVDPTPGQPDPVPPSPDPGPAPNPGPTDPEDGSDDGQGGKHSVTKVDLLELNAYQTQEGIVLKWRTGYELNNLGFHIYREENGESYRITPEMIMGSVWLTGKATPLNGGRSYTWWDTSGLNTQSSSLSPVRYWLEDIDLSGKRTLHGPVEVAQPANESQLIASKPSSNYAKKLDAKYEEFWKIQDLRERLREAPPELGSSTELPTRTTRVSSSPRTRKAKHAASEVFTVTEPRKRQWSLAAKPAVKLLIKEEGWYRVTQPELVAAGLDPNCKPKYLQLFVDGEEQAMLVTGSGDGRFNTSDAIEFYATGLDTQFTDTRVYWLVDTSTPGKRVRTVNASGVPTPSTSYLHTVKRKDRIYYLADLLNGEESNFFGLEIWNVSWPQTDQILTLPHLDTDVTPNAILEVTLQGYSLVPHLVNVLVNDHPVGEVTFDDWSKVTVSFEIPQNWLWEGDNLVTFVPPDDEVDVTLIVSVKLSYWHTFTADDDALKLTATGGEAVSITGFTGSNIRVIDITDPKNSYEAIATVEAQGGGYSVTFNVPGTGVRTVLAFTDQKLKTPSEIVANHPTEWHNKQEGYNYVMMVHGDVAKDFKLHHLKQSRERQGFTVATVDVEDIYDEFSFGAKDTRALKDFLERAMNQWVKKPQYVLLVGDATFDPRDFLGMGQIDFVPTKIVEATFLETASDDWFVDFDDDGLPNIPIGRLPARTPEELSTIVSKIVTYDRSKQKTKGALLVAGKKLYGEEDYDFEAAVQDIANMLEDRMTVAEIFQDQVGDAAAREALLAGVNQSPSIVNFVGHGSNEVWASLFCSDDAPALTNSPKLAFFINMTCLNGFFHDLYTESLAEALMRAEEGGAVAVWTSSGLTYPDQQHLINQELIRQLLSSEKITIGQAATSAKAATIDEDVRRTWILFGDPATRLRY